jgi:hypothetical protein
LPYRAVSASLPKTWVIAIGVGSTFPCEIVTSSAANTLKLIKNARRRNLIINNY